MWYKLHTWLRKQRDKFSAYKLAKYTFIRFVTHIVRRTQKSIHYFIGWKNRLNPIFRHRKTSNDLTSNEYILRVRVYNFNITNLNQGYLYMFLYRHRGRQREQSSKEENYKLEYLFIYLLNKKESIHNIKLSL